MECVYLQRTILPVAVLGDFNVHNTTWLKHSNKTDDAGHEADSFAITYGLEQMVMDSSHIPDVEVQFASTLDLFLTSNPDPYTVKVSRSSSRKKPLSSQVTDKLLLQQCAKFNSDLKGFLDWVREFNASKTQTYLFSRKVNSTVPDIVMNNETVLLTFSITMLEITIGDS
ncbi:hypothetical protein HHI36_016679 [Cryptolaemus montrouzieri]|uniref:Endonuclease/exonuclease/phosphatase domain-containing protein n=1 Tax=Cryptolaemus montrouzieri TaxID=559131 RepID=A0ABD2NKH6_9CUCU